MAYYDSRQFNNMRNDAIRRSREMYKNSVMNTTRHYSQADSYKKEVQNQQISEKNDTEPKQEVSQNNTSSNSLKLPENISKIFDGKLDSEKLTIIALMVILAKEGADMKLIIALVYILM